MNRSEMFWQTYLKIENEMLEISKYIYITDEPNDSQLKVFSPYIADLLIRVCVEIEAISKELYYNLGEEKKRGDNSLKFDVECLKKIDMIYKTSKKMVYVSCPMFNLTKDNNRMFRPLNNAHKTQGTAWESAYQAIKHDRYESLSKGNVRNLLHALGALYLLNIYNRNVKLYSKYTEVYKLDFSFGSAIFSVKKPDEKYVIDTINNKMSDELLVATESPFILKYTDYSYNRVIDLNNKTNKKILEYVLSQLEASDEEFTKRLDEIINERRGRLLIQEFYMYKINKKIPSTLPFMERKKLLVQSNEWKSLNESNFLSNKIEITEENIQDLINKVGNLYGFKVQKNIEGERLSEVFDAQCEIILDNGTIKYPS